MKPDYILSTLDYWEDAKAGTLISSLDPAARQAAEAVMCYCRELRWIIHRHEDPDVQNDETRYAIDLAVERLRKASAKASQPHVRDQIRLACRQLNAVRQPAPADTEPIDIFDI